MPLFIAALLGALASAAGHLVGRVLIALGIGFVSYQGIDTALAFVKTQMLAQVSGLPASMLALLGVMKIGIVMSILLSALTARMTLNGLQSGAVKKMVQK